MNLINKSSSEDHDHWNKLDSTLSADGSMTKVRGLKDVFLAPYLLTRHKLISKLVFRRVIFAIGGLFSGSKTQAAESFHLLYNV